VTDAAKALAALVLVSAAARFAAALAVPGPWITPDETLYALLGRDLWSRGSLTVLGGDAPYYSLVYPALIGLPLQLGDVEVGYRLVQALQAVVLSATAIPVYLWGRTAMAPRWALAAAALTVAIPGLAYAGLLMTEVAFYPAMTLGAWAAARAFERPTLQRQALLLGAVALAVATRLQALVLLPALVTAAVPLRSVRSLWPTWAALAGLGAVWAAWQGLAGYAAAGETSYPVGEAAEFVVYHAGDAAWLTGIVPAIALVLLVLRPPAERPARVLVAVAASFTAWLVLEVGVFASVHVERLAERDLLATAPLLFLALCLWLDRGAPRTRLTAALAALAVAALVLAVPWDDFSSLEALPDAFSIAPLLEVDPVLAASVATAGLAALGVLLPRAAPPVLLALFVLVSAVASVKVADRAEEIAAPVLGPEPRWVDRAANGRAAYVYDGEAHWNAVWLNAFWNRELERVLLLPDTHVPGAIRQTAVEVLPDGRLEGAPERPYAVVSSFAELAGERVAEAVQVGTDQRALVLWRVEQPLRIRWRVTGVRANGDVHSAGRLTVYGCGPGNLVLTLIAKQDLQVDLVRNERRVRTLTYRSGEIETVRVPSHPGGGICTFDIRPTGTLGTTQFRFEPTG
jgi:hypothetical protein